MTTQSPRAPLEILKFLTPRDLISVSLLSHYWLHLSETDELWLTYLSPSGLQAWPTFQSEGCRAKEAYRKIVSPFVAMIRGSRLLMYHYANSEWRGKDLPIPALTSDDTVLTSLGNGQLFAYNSTAVPSTTFRISPATGTVTFLPRMRQTRLYPGLLRYENYLFAFCGRLDPVSNRCEKFNLTTEQWEKLPNSMFERYAFNPVLHGTEIYLSLGNCPHIEVFSPGLDSFSPVKLKTSVVSSSANVVFEQKLVSFGIGKGLFFSFEDKKYGERMLSLRPLRAWSSFDPVLYGNTVVLTWAYSAPWMVAVIDVKTMECKTIDVPF